MISASGVVLAPTCICGSYLMRQFLTWGRLQKRGWIGPNRCPLCLIGGELASYLFCSMCCSCHFTTKIWSFISWIGHPLQGLWSHRLLSTFRELQRAGGIGGSGVATSRTNIATSFEMCGRRETVELLIVVILCLLLIIILLRLSLIGGMFSSCWWEGFMDRQATKEESAQEARSSYPDGLGCIHDRGCGDSDP